MKKLLYTIATAGIFAFATHTFAQPSKRHDDKPGFPPPAVKPGDHRPTPPGPAAKPGDHRPPQPGPAAKPGPGPHHDEHKPGPPVIYLKSDPEPHHPHPGPGPHHPQPGPGPHHPQPGPGPHHPPYRPGFKAYSLPRPFAVEYYRDWIRPTHKQYFTLFNMPETMQLRLYTGQEFEIKLEEERKEGYSWFARYDAYYVDVDVDHEKGHRNLFGHRDRYAEIEIKGKRPGVSLVELIYADRRGWDNGDAPEKVIQVFVFTE
ncbi:MAG: hypothetical protein IKR81_01595 [Victivallales bacterium]|nr:hypothetical protein [Victivallales bacterium]